VRVGGVHRRTITLSDDGWAVDIIDQTRLPWQLRVLRIDSLAAAAHAIRDMQVRGAPLIGALAAYGVCLALRASASPAALEQACAELAATRPTAINLGWALARVRGAVQAVGDAGGDGAARVAAAYACAAAICEDDVATCQAIGQHGAAIFEATWRAVGRNRPLRVLTHCNAGWLATVDHGTALAPVYLAHDRGMPLHVWVDETRPRNQGMLTAWELGQHGVPHTVVADNAGGHLLQRGQVDLVIVGTDRTCANGDVCNKIGTYLKALAARDAGVPFYVALPHSSIDWTLGSGAEVPIEERAGRELREVIGRGDGGVMTHVTVVPEATAVANPAFDVTPARLITGLITERGVCEASETGLRGLYPERA